MSAQVCAECTAAYSIGAPQCPQCGANNPRPLGDEPNGPSTHVRCPGQDCEAYGVVRHVPVQLAAPGVEARPPLHCTVCGRALETVHDDEEGEGMPKVTKEGGPSIEGTDETNVEMANGELVHLDADETADEGGEESSPTPEQGGGTFSESSEKEQTSPETSENETPSRARTTGSRSAKGRTAGSTARGTAGGQTAPSSDRSEG